MRILTGMKNANVAATNLVKWDDLRNRMNELDDANEWPRAHAAFNTWRSYFGPEEHVDLNKLVDRMCVSMFRGTDYASHVAMAKRFVLAPTLEESVAALNAIDKAWNDTIEAQYLAANPGLRR